MKVVYICHPIGGDVENNLTKIRQIVKRINLSNPTVIPFVPYYADVVSMSDDIPEQRQRGLKNDLALISRKGVVDELWIFGNTISAGMRQEIVCCWENKIPVIATSETLHLQLETIRRNWQQLNN